MNRLHGDGKVVLVADGTRLCRIKHNVTVSGITFLLLGPITSTNPDQRPNLSLPSVSVRGWPQSSSAQARPAFVLELVPSEDLFRRGNTRIHQ